MVVEDVVGDLEGVAERKRIFGDGLLLLGTAVRDGGGHACAGFEEARGLAFDDAEVAGFIHAGVMRVDHLDHLAFAQAVGGVGQGLHDAQIARLHHHLEGTCVEEVAYEHGCAVAPAAVGRRTAAAHVAFVHDVVVHQSGRMQKLDRGAEILMERPFIAECSADEHQKGGAHAFAARARDVFADFLHAGHVAGKFAADDRVDGGHVFGDGREHLFDEGLGILWVLHIGHLS